MYYIAPASFAFLSIPWFFIEARQLWSDPKASTLLGSPVSCLYGCLIAEYWRSLEVALLLRIPACMILLLIMWHPYLC